MNGFIECISQAAEEEDLFVKHDGVLKGNHLCSLLPESIGDSLRRDESSCKAQGTGLGSGLQVLCRGLEY